MRLTSFMCGGGKFLGSALVISPKNASRLGQPFNFKFILGRKYTDDTGPDDAEVIKSSDTDDSSTAYPRKVEQKRGVLVKSTVPEYFPDLIAIPVIRRPVFPGFYKTITIHNSIVAKEITEAFRNRKPYIGLFLKKNDNELMKINESSVPPSVVDSQNSRDEFIETLDDIHKVGVLAQVVNLIPGSDFSEGECIFYSTPNFEY
jgi:hypothetical protein